MALDFDAQAFQKLNQQFAISYNRTSSVKFRLTFDRGFGSLRGERGGAETLGTGPFTPLGTGGYAAKLMLFRGVNASMGLPLAATNSVDHVGEYNATLDAVAISPSYAFASTQLKEGAFIGAQPQFGTQNWIDWMMNKEMGPQLAIAAGLAGVLSTTGENYNIDAVTEEVVISSASTAYPIKVNCTDRFYINQEIEIQEQGGSPITGLGKGHVTSKQNTFGPAYIYVKFPALTGGPHTVEAGDLINVYGGYAWNNTTGQTGVEGWGQWVEDAACPRNEGSNISLDDQQYRATRFNIGAQQISAENLYKFIANMWAKAGSTIGPYNGGLSDSGYLNEKNEIITRNALVVNPLTKLQMGLEYFQRGATRTPMPVIQENVLHEDGIFYDTFNGIPLIPDPTNLVSEAYLLNLSCIGIGIVKEYGPMFSSGSLTDWMPKTGGSTIALLPRDMAFLILPLNRDRIGYMYGSGNIGMTLEPAGP